jgi:DNA (cytosine-5)-methyltransferase 1
MAAYYNEHDAYAAQWLRNLITKGLIANGEVDTRSIVDVHPDELRGFTQCHFFAGIGGWSHALRLAGWPDDRPVWTGSCPCQPFSVAGKGLGADDPRHLWPHFHRLIAARRPPVVFGEQVAGAAGYGWLDGVRSDLAGEGYACEAFDIPACAVDAPHIRSRLY